MDNTVKTKYMNPITFEAEMFVHKLQNLSKSFRNVDAVLIASLEKVINAIENFVNSDLKEIVETENIELVECQNIHNIEQSYHCARCYKQLGSSAEVASLHLIDKCNNDSIDEAPPDLLRNSRLGKREKNSLKDRDQEKPNGRLYREARRRRQQKSTVELTRKGRYLLRMEFDTFVHSNVKNAIELEDEGKYDEIADDILKSIASDQLKNNVKIYKFGSRLAGCGSSLSDLDLFVDYEDTYDVFENYVSEKTKETLQFFAKNLTLDSNWTNLKIINCNRVPILKVTHVRTKIACDISFSNGISLSTTSVLKYFFEIQPIARVLCIFIKKWLNRTKRCSKFNSYGMTLMVLFYLQTVGLIPSIERIQENVSEEERKYIGPWLISYERLTLQDLNIEFQVLNQETFSKLLSNFFIFYQNFDFDSDIICPYLGRAIKKSDVENAMPIRYTEYVKRCEDYALKVDNPIVVQNVFSLGNNVTCRISAEALKQLVALMDTSLNVIQGCE